LDGASVKNEAIPNKDHRGVARFGSRSEEGYEIVAGHLQSCLREYARRIGQPSPSANLHVEVLGPAAQEDAGLKGMLVAYWGKTNQVI